MKLTGQQIKKFQKTIFGFYDIHKRNALPWRKSITPYKIWISEVMLQQTQVDRVIDFFHNWMKLFPDIASLANAPQSDVLRAWKGLGYNSRALRLKQSAQLVVEKYHGKFPKNYSDILDLPGIGPYTAGAIMAFAYNQKTVIIETNIRRVFIHHFFNDKNHVHDRDILDLVNQTLPAENFRQWYWALMDYGSYLAKIEKENPNRKSRHYTKQKKFIGSDRQIRGRVLDLLLIIRKMSIETVEKKVSDLSNDFERIEKVLSGLEKDGFIEINKSKIFLK